MPMPSAGVRWWCVALWVWCAVVFLLAQRAAARRRRRWRVLAAVCCIDPRADELPACLAAVAAAAAPVAPLADVVAVVGIVRRRDAACARHLRAAGAAVLTVPDYPAPLWGHRHHYGGLAAQRTRALVEAQRRGADAVWFVDSDVRPHPSTLHHALLGLAAGADVVGVPYAVRWAAAGPDAARVGYRTAAGGSSVEPPRANNARRPFHPAVVVGMGCTLVRTPSWWHGRRVPDRFGVAEAAGITGEDVAFGLAAERRGARVWVSNWCPRPVHLGAA